VCSDRLLQIRLINVFCDGGTVGGSLGVNGSSEVSMMADLVEGTVVAVAMAVVVMSWCL